MAGTFERINSVTIRIDTPHRKAIGWLMEVAWPAEGSPQRWVARVGNHASEPLLLDEAKKVAKEFLNKPEAQPPRLNRRPKPDRCQGLDRAYGTCERLTEVAYSVEGNGHIPLYRPEGTLLPACGQTS